MAKAYLTVHVDFDEEKFREMIEKFKSEHPDFIEVVRCKDCKYRDPEDKKCDSFVRFKNPFPTYDNEFCSYGEKKDEEVTK